MLTYYTTLHGRLITTWHCDRCDKQYVREGDERLRLNETLESTVTMRYTYRDKAGVDHHITDVIELCEECTDYINSKLVI